MKKLSSVLGASLAVLCFTCAPVRAAEPAKKPHEYYSASSVEPFIKIAIKKEYCSFVNDAFDRRTCQKQWRKFSKKMLGWTRKNSVLEESFEVGVSDYDFKKSAFTLTYDKTSPTLSLEDEDLRHGVVVGKAKCTHDPDMEITALTVDWKLNLKMKASVAQESFLRRTEEMEIVALLKGRPASINWCCTRGQKRFARANRIQCRQPTFQYSVTGYLISGEGGEVLKASVIKTPYEVNDFDPSILGVPVPSQD
jgi:hypothetical protein